MVTVSGQRHQNLRLKRSLAFDVAALGISPKSALHARHLAASSLRQLKQQLRVAVIDAAVIVISHATVLRRLTLTEIQYKSYRALAFQRSKEARSKETILDPMLKRLHAAF